MPARVIFCFCLAFTARADVVITGKVVDENSVAVAGVRIELDGPGATAFRSASDSSGNFSIALEAAGEYRIRAERPGFFVFNGGAVRFQEGTNDLQITLHHLQEFAESVDVTYSPPAIDYQEAADRKQLNNLEVIEVPYPSPHDIRNSLPLLPGVLQDTEGRLHFNGGGTSQTNFQLDGFNLSDPVTGRFEARVNIDSVRSVELESGRFSAEKGRGSAGTLDIRTQMGDDRWRFGATNFFPGISTENGLHVDKWTPRFTVSGPIAKGRAWFHNGFDTFYDVDIVQGLPRGENRSRGLTTSDLSRFQVNLTPANILTGSVLLNFINTTRYGLSFLDPVETTTNRRQNFLMTMLRDQIYFSRGALVEFGFSDSRAFLRHSPQGNETFEITPYGRRGNYFVDLTRRTYRQQWTASAFLPTFQKHGTHQVKAGVDLERASFDQFLDRHDYRVLRSDWSMARFVTFAGNRNLERSNFEVAQYVQDRWAPVDALLIEVGLRNDWDQVIRNVLWSPRISAAYAPKWMRETKLAAGYGVFHDSLSLGIISRHLDQVSYSTFFQPDGTILRGPIPTAFEVNEHTLRAPRFRTLSLSVERKLPFQLYGKAAYTRRSGDRGLTYVSDFLEGGYYRLRNTRRDRYDAFEVSTRRTFAGQFEWFAGYTRSSARTNAVIDYSLENPIFGAQGPGRFAWDAPNRFMTWGWAPVSRRIVPRRLSSLVGETNVAYLIEYRTGFPFSVVNEEGFLAGPANSVRLPSYFNINLHFERRFRFLHYLWAWRFGMNNITNSRNPNSVNNNIDSSTYLTYGRGQHRAFSVRLRFLGKR